MGEVFYRQTVNLSGAALETAADVVVVVDESGSIAMETHWLREVGQRTHPIIIGALSHSV